MKALLLSTLSLVLNAVILVPSIQAQKPLGALNAKSMQRGYFYTNQPIAIPKTAANSYSLLGGLSINVLEEENAVFAGKYLGKVVLISNTGLFAMNIPTQDGRLSMVHEAKIDNRWVEIEYLPSSWCGNSYYDVSLPARSAWKIVAPRYTGSKEVTMRLKLSGARPWPIYSNIFVESINPEQLEIKKPYQVKGIMDPYLE